jgi:lysyl-tRNA synthetase, class II
VQKGPGAPPAQTTPGLAPLWWRTIASTATALAALVSLISSLSMNLPARQRLLEALEPPGVATAAHVIGVVTAMALLCLSWGVLRGRRRASRAAVAVLGALVIVHAAKGLDYEEALIALGAAAVLAAGLRASARGRRPSRAAVALVLALIGAAGAYCVLLSAYLRDSGGPVSAALARAADSLLDGDRLATQPAVRLPVHVFVGVGIVAVAVALRALFAPARARDGHDWAEHGRAAELVAAHGEDSISPFLLRADKAFFFAHGGLLAYRTLRETAVVSGDPVGPPGTAAAIVASFMTFAAERGWDVVVLGARAEHLPAYHGLGLRSLRIGSEAVVDAQAFSIAGRARKTVRKAVHRIERHGWTIELVPAAGLDAKLVAEVDAVERAWRRHHRQLYGFAMASDRLWGAPEDAEDLYALARSPTGELRAFQRYVPFRDGLSLDAMRRLDDEPNGICDALVAAVLAHARERGLREVSLNFAGFAHLMAAETLERRSQRLGRWALQRMHGRFQLERLLRFAAKFGPTQRPRYLIFTRYTRLPLAGFRVMQAEAYFRPLPASPRQDAWRPLAMPIAMPRQRHEVTA